MKKLLLLCVTILLNIAGTHAQCVTPSLTSASASGPICSGTTLNLFANGPVNVTGYSWTGPNSFTSTLQNPFITSVGTAASGMYAVTVINGVATCSATYTAAALVNASPVPSYVISANPICISSQVVISPATAWCNPFALGCNGVSSTASTATVVSAATDNVTIEGWVLWNGGGNQVIFSNGNAGADGYAIQIVDGGGTLQVTLGGVGYMSSSAQLSLGTRQHLALVRNSGTWTLYLNGTPHTLTSATSTPNTPSTGFYIGNNNSGANAFSGYIANVAFWTIARSAAQIQADMNVCSQSPVTGLAGYWALSDGAGASVTDASGNGNILTLLHTTWHATLISGAYTWNYGDGTSGAGSAPAHVYSTSGTYTVVVTSSSCSGSASKTVTVNAFPVAGTISGSAFICAGSSATLSNTTTGGVWSSASSTVATVSSGGVVSGVAAGTSVISYTVSNVCGSAAATKVATINALPATGTIAGSNTVCTGANTTLTNAAGGGVWSSSNTSAATISTAGTVTGIGAGTTTISYTVTTGFCTLSATSVVTVSAAASAGTITGATGVCTGSSTMLNDGVSGGVWSSSNTSIANVDASGNVSGAAGGTATISYSVTTCNTAVAAFTITVNTLPSVSFTSAAVPPLCTNTSVTYTTQSGEHNYTWSVDGTADIDYIITSGGVDFTNSTVTLQWITPANRTVSVSYTDANGCVSGTSNTTTITGPPVIAYNVTPSLACTGKPISFIPEAGAWCNSHVANMDEGSLFETNFIPILDNLTMEAWVQPQAAWYYAHGTTYGVSLFSNGDNRSSSYGGYGLYINQYGFLEIRLPGSYSCTSSASIPFDQKSHVAIVRNAGIWSIYVNGVQYGVTNAGASPLYFSYLSMRLTLGGQGPNAGELPDYACAELISNASLWSVPHSTAQIQDDMNSCSLSPQSGLEAYWPLDGEPSDHSGNGHNPFDIYNIGWPATYAASQYLWDFGDGSIAAGGSPWHAYSAPGTYAINVTSTLCPGSSIVAVNIVDTLAAVGSIAGTTTLCPGVTSLLTDIVTSGTWSSTDPTITTIDGSGHITTVATGTATISYSVSNVCGTAAATATVTVAAAPTITFTAAPPASYCMNAPATYTTQAGQTNYVWNVQGTAGVDYTITAGGIGSSSNSVTLQWLSTGTKTVTVNYTGAGCGGTIAASATTVIDALPLFSASPNPVCLGTPTTFAFPQTCNSSVLSFNGSTSTASRGAPVSIATNNITMEGLVLWNGGAGNQQVFGNGATSNNGYAVYLVGGTVYILLGNVAYLVSSYNLIPGERTHLAMVRNSGIWSLYVNGVQYPVTNSTVTPNTPTAGTYIGCSDAGDHFNGQVSNVAFWTIARSATQIHADMNACSLAPQTALTAYWQLNEGSGTTAIDGSGNGNNLTLTNTGWVTTPSYTWSFGDGGTSTLTSVSNTYAASGTYTASLTMTNPVGCGTTATQIITVNATPPSPGTINGPLALCAGFGITLSDAAPGGVWSSGTTGIATVGSSGMVTGVAPGTALISYTVNNGCTANTTAIVTVNTTAVTFTATPPAQLCPNINATYTTLAGQSGYVWTVPGVAGTDYTITAGGTGSSSNSVTLAWHTPGAKVVSINYTGTSGCGAATAAIDTTNINAVPAAGFIALPNPLCVETATSFIPGNNCNSPLLNFNGSNSTASRPTVISTATDNITIEAWVQWNGGTNQTIFLNGNPGNSGYGLNIFNSSGQLQILMGGVVFATSAATLTAGVKTHVAIVRNTGTWSVYVNGVPYSVSAPTASPNTPGTGFFVGSNNGGANPFNGTISNVAFWYVPRTTTQIQADMITCTLSPQAGLAGYWTLGEGSGTTAHDLSGNLFNLTLSNATWSATTPISSYSWSFGDGSTSTVASPVHTYTAAGTFTSSLTVTTPVGCGSTATTTIAVIVPNAGTITGTPFACIGATIPLSDGVTGGMWSSGSTGIAAIGSTNGVVTGIAAGTATISYTVNNSCGATAATIIVTVNTPPTATFTSTPPSSYCSSVTVTYTTQPGQSGYVWTLPGVSGADYIITAGGTSSTSNSVTLFWTAAGAKTVSVSYTGAGGCAGTASNTTTVNVSPTPVSCSANPNPACVGTAVNFRSNYTCNSSVLNFNGSNSTASIGAPISTATDNVTLEAWMQWNGGANQVIFINGNGGSTGYQLGVSDASGTLQVLLGGVAVLSSSVQLSTGIRQHVALVRNSGTWSVYLNGIQYSVTSAASTPNTPNTGFFVGNSNGGGNSFNGTISNVAFWTVARGTVQIQGDMESCTLSPQTGLAGYWALGEGSGTTAIDASGNGHNLALTNTIWTVPTGSYTYNWNFGDGGTSTLGTPAYSYSAVGTYTPSLTVTGTGGCSYTATTALTVNTTPAAGTITGSLAVCTGATTTLSDPTGTGGGVWSSLTAGVAGIGSSTGVLTAVTAGTTLISYTVNNGCVVSATAIITVNTTTPVFASTPSGPICPGVPATYTAPSGQSNYAWALPGVSGTDYNITGGGTGTSSNSVTLNWLTSGSKTVTVNYTSPGGCTGLIAASNTISVNVAPDVAFSATPNPVCIGNATTFLTSGACRPLILNFNGSNSSASYGTPVSTAVDNITMEAWVQWNGGANQVIFLNGNPGNSGYGLQIFNTSGQMQLLMGGVSFATSAASLTAGVPTYVAIVRNAGTWSIYVNDVPYSISTPTATPNTPGTGFFVGNDNTGTYSFNGIISNVSFWNVARSTVQILADMTSCAMAPQSGLVGYWAFGEGTGTTAFDVSGSGHNLGLTNISWAAQYTSYTWSYGDGATSTLPGATHTYTAAGTYSSSLTVTNSSGCFNTATAIVTVNPTPVIGGITGTLGLCLSSTTALTDATVGGTWSSGNLSVATIGTNGVVTGLTTGTAAITYTANPSCVATTTTIVTVNTTPVISGITGVLSLCPSSSTALSDATTGGTWSSGNPSVATIGTNGVVTGVTPGTAAISYTANPSCVATTTTMVTVNTITPVFTAAPSALLCPGVPATYTALSGQSNYLWTLPGISGTDYTITAGGTDPSSNTVTINWLTAGSKTVTINYTSPSGCTGLIAASTTATVNAIPVASFVVTPDPVCVGNPAIFAAHTSCTPVVLNFNGSNSQATFGAPISAVTDNVTIEAWVQWNGGANQVIFLNGNAGNSGYGLHIFNTSGQLEILMGGVAFSASSASLTPGVATYVAIVRNSGTWSVCVNNVPYSIADPTATPNPPGTGFYAGAANDGTNVFNGIISNISFWTMARSTAQMQADMNSCTLNPQTGLAGYWQLGEGTGTTGTDGSGNAHNLSLNNTAWITAPPSYLNGAFSSYAWTFGDGATSTLTNPVHTYTASGTYTSSLVAVNTLGCTGSATTMVTVNTTPAVAAITGTPVVLCAGATVTVSDAVAGGVWSSDATSIASIGSSGIITGASPGTAAISYTMNNGCIVSATTIATVNTVSPAFTTVPSAANCVNLPVTYTTQSGQTNYAWALPGASGTDYTITAGGTGSSDSTVTLSWLTAGNKTVTVNYTGPAGCTGTTPATNATIISNSYPVFVSSVNPSPVCANTAATFLASSGWCNDNAIGVSGGSFLFSSANITNGASFTFEAWVQWNGGTTDQGIFCYNPSSRSYGLSVQAGGTLQVVVYTSDFVLHHLTSAAVLTSGAHAHVALKYLSGNWFIYLNGVEYPVSPSATPVIANATINVGRDNVSPNNFNGLISNVAYWRTAHTASQVVSDMNSCTPVTLSSLSGYWPLNDGSGSTAADLSPSNHPLTLTNSSMWTSPVATNTYAWSFGDGTTGTGSNPVHVYSVASVYTPSAIATNSSGCSTTVTNTVTVNEAPSLAGASNALVCIGGTLSLFANTPSNVGSYSWAGPNTFSSTDQDPLISSATTAASGTYTVTLYGAGTSCSAFYTTSPTVNPTPALAAAIAPALACIGGSMSLVAQSPSNVTGYSWAGPNSFSATTSGPSLSGLTTAASGIYSVTVNNGAGSGCTALYTTSPVQVTTIPVIGAISGSTSVCVGGESALNDTTAGGFWFSSDESVATISDAGLLTGIGDGMAEIDYAAYNICGINERFTMITVSGTPAAISGPGNVCVGGNVTLTDAAASGIWSSGATGVATVGSSTGIVSGIAAGTAIISYAAGSGCLAIFVITVNAATDISSISGSTTVCAGSTTNLTDATTGGIWSSSNTAVATIGSTGVVIGLTVGTSTITYAVTSGCGTSNATVVISVNASSAAGTINGTATACIGGSTSLTDATTGGTWSSGTPGVGTIDGAGNVTGLAAGTTTISYTTAGTCGIATATDIVTVNPLPNAGSITGAAYVCIGNTISLTDAVSGGTWSSTATGIGTIDATGDVTGITGGTTTVSYLVTNSCGAAGATTTVTVNMLPNAGSISGPVIICIGNITSLTDATAGGTWSSTTPGVATIDGTGNVTGLAAGTTTISYSISSSCGNATATFLVTVDPIPVVGSVNGTATICQGASTTLTDGTSGGAWSSGNPAIASINATGLLSGISGGAAQISYTVSSSCGNVSSELTVTINPLPATSTITGPSSVSVGANILLTDVVTGGVWSAGNSNATVSGGIVTGAIAGTVTISYAVTNGCGSVAATKVITVTPSSVTGIIGAGTVCVGGTITLTNPTAGGTWSSHNTFVATVGSSGVITGVAAGTSAISYTISGTVTTTIVTVNLNPSGFVGPTTVCIGSSIIISDLIAGGSWASTSGTSITPAGTESANVTGLSAGVALITYTLPTGCFITRNINVNTPPSPILGTNIVCVGSTAFFSDATSGGVSWTSGDTSVARISASGAFTPITPGTTAITYTISNSCIATMPVTVNSLPAVITGNTPVCQGASITLSDVTAAATWSSNNMAIATIGSSTGTVTGISGGNATISYFVTGTIGCIATAVVTVNGIPTGTLSGASAVYIGSSITLTDAVTGGTWTTSNSNATVSSGVVSGVFAGAVTISYAVTNTCGTAYATKIITVSVSPVSGIAGTANECVGAVTALTDATPGGTWSSGNNFVATVTTSGIVTGVAAGTAMISYTVAGIPATLIVTVNANPSGLLSTSSICVGASATVSDITAGGTWTSTTNASTITTGSATGLVTGLTAGTAVISYSLSTGCYKTLLITVHATPVPVSGVLTVCVGAAIHLTDATSPGVSWTSGNTSVATISGSGTVIGVTAGTSIMTYAITAGCAATATVTVNPLPVVADIAGPSTVSHTSGPITLSDATAGGVWSSTHITVATIGSASGTVTAIATSGTTTISYTLTNVNGCTNAATKTETASSAPPPHSGTTVDGTTTLFAGSSVNLADDIISGTWTSSNTAVATVNETGLVNALSPGSTNISHIVINSDGEAFVTVTPLVVSAMPVNLRLVPNPNNGTFTVKGTLGSTQDEEVSLEITDVLGQIVYKNKIIAPEGKINETILLTNSLANGTYTLNIQSGTEKMAFHFVMEK